MITIGAVLPVEKRQANEKSEAITTASHLTRLGCGRWSDLWPVDSTICILRINLSLTLATAIKIPLRSVALSLYLNLTHRLSFMLGEI
jgi:hypothetical protein